MRGVHCQSHVCKMEGIGQVDQRDCNDMMRYQFLEVLARLLLREQEHNHLLCPVCRLEQIVGLNLRQLCPVWEGLVHAIGIKVPHWRLLHDIQAKWPEEAEVDCSVCLLHEARLLPSSLHAGLDREWPEYPLHDELARKCEDDCVEAHEGEVACALAILDGCA